MTPRARHRRAPRRSRCGFTLTELMIAIVVLIGVLLATSKIFSTTSKVTSAGKAAADIMQEVSAIERQIRADFARLSRDGVLAIRNVAVDNDVNPAVLLNPNLPPDAKLRCDQIVFFADGVQSPQTFLVGAGLNHKGQGTSGRVYYGHVFQLGEAGGPVDLDRSPIVARDPAEVVYPWTSGQIDMQFTKFDHNNSNGTDMFEAQGSFTTNLPPPDARTWGFGRQAVILVDDDKNAIDSNDKTEYLGQVLAARSLFLQDPRLGFAPQIMHGRVDASAMELNELRQLVQYTPFPAYLPRPWSRSGNPPDQFSTIARGLLYYPRAERYAPSMHRIDQALTSHLLGSACSSVRIEWTYAEGAGVVRDPLGDVLFAGFAIDYATYPSQPHPWFGMDAPYDTEGNGRDTAWFGASTVFFENVERYPITGFGAGVDVYEAVFGYNQSEPLDSFGVPHQTLGYTPWPSAIRITLTIHDPATTLEGGRDVQFVIRLPDRGGLASR